MIFALLCSGLAHAEVPQLSESEADLLEDSAPTWELAGFVRPYFKVVHRATAQPEDQLELGMGGTRVGLIFKGQALERWDFKANLQVGGDSIPAVTGVSTVDLDNSGSVDTLSTSSREVMTNIVRETSLTWSPRPFFGLKLGRMPIPFTSQAQSADTALLFPERSSPNQIFLADDDLGGLILLKAGDILLVSMGAFNGTGVGAGSSSQLGALYTARIDIQPLGSYSFDETGQDRDRFLIGFGAGAALHPYTSYDSAGYPAVDVSDMRYSLSGRMAYKGLSAGGEILFRLQTDSLSSRPQMARGSYFQLGWRAPSGMEPIFRMGGTTEDMTFDPRLTIWTEAGLNLYPKIDNDRVRFTGLYLQEQRVTEEDLARGGAAQIQLTW